MVKKSKNAKLIESFTDYCVEHPEFRFWQALRNWSGGDAIMMIKDTWEVDTFYWNKKDEFKKSVEE